MSDNNNLILHTMGEGIFNQSLGDAILSSAEKEIFNPSLMAASMQTQLGLAMNAMANHQFHGGRNLEDALEMLERSENLFLLITVFVEQSTQSVEKLRQPLPDNLVQFNAEN